ncbi:hypothetical protein [Hydrogenobaculum acidophilum]
MINRFPVFLIMERLEQNLKEQQKALSVLLISENRITYDFLNAVYDLFMDTLGLSYTLIGMMDENIDKYTKEHIFLISSEVLSMFNLSIPYLEAGVPFFIEDTYIDNLSVQEFVGSLASYIEKAILEESFSRDFILDSLDKLLRHLMYFQYVNEKIPRYL